MRVTAKAKEKTKREILDAARKLFQNQGYQQTTTRDVARVAGLATGTLFNYFSTKEELALSIAGGCFAEAETEFQERRRGDEAVEELLFAHVATTLRHLRPHRGYVAEVLNSAVSLLGKATATGEGERIRNRHLDTVKEILTIGGHEPSPVHLHMYWTLLLGVLAYWTADESPRQEDTLVLLDQSMRLFVHSLGSTPDQPMEVSDGPDRD